MAKCGIWYAKLKIVSGRGGDGIISWERNRYNSRMGPAGGDGGNGGSVLVEVDPKISDLSHLNYRAIAALSGGNGKKSNKNGKSPKNIILKVPINSLIYDLDKKMKLSCLSNWGESYEIAKGGRGGRGNKSFKNAQLQAPWLYELGEKGESKNVLFKIKNSHLVGLFIHTEDLSDSINNLDFNSLLKHRIEIVNFLFSDVFKKKFNDHLYWCNLYMFYINAERPNLAGELLLLNNFLQTIRPIKVLIMVKGDIEIQKEYFSKKVWQLAELIFLNKGGENLTTKLIKICNSINSDLPLLMPNSNENDEYVEYSDSLLPNKEELTITKTDYGWNVNSRQIKYWGDRIPQTTLHNIERLKNKLQIEGIMKQIKKSGGKKGEKLQIGVFETEIY